MPSRNIVEQIPTTTHDFHCRSFGNSSRMQVMMFSTMANWESSPRVKSIRKKSSAQRVDTGRRVTSSG